MSDSQEAVITLDMSKLLTPISVVVGAIIISVALFLSGGKSDTPTAQAPSVQGAVDDGTVPTENVSGSIDIAGAPVLGDVKNAKVAIVEFSDYECPFCKRHHTETYPSILQDYVDTGKVIFVYKHYPLDFHNPLATQQANAAECVRDLKGDEAFFAFSEKIYTTTNSNGNGMTLDTLYGLGDDLGVSADKIEDCVTSEKYSTQIADSLASGSSAGVQGTPGFIIGTVDGTMVSGEIVSGAVPYADFQQVFEKYLN